MYCCIAMPTASKRKKENIKWIQQEMQQLKEKRNGCQYSTLRIILQLICPLIYNDLNEESTFIINIQNFITK